MSSTCFYVGSGLKM